MALTDEKFLDLVVTKFKQKLDSIETKDDLITFLSGVTKTKIKTFINNAIQAEADKLRVSSADHNTMADDEEAAKTEIDAL